MYHKRTKNKKTWHTRQPMSILSQQAPRAATVTAFHTKQDDYDNTHDWTALQEKSNTNKMWGGGGHINICDERQFMLLWYASVLAIVVVKHHARGVYLKEQLWTSAFVQSDNHHHHHQSSIIIFNYHHHHHYQSSIINHHHQSSSSSSSRTPPASSCEVCELRQLRRPPPSRRSSVIQVFVVWV